MIRVVFILVFLSGMYFGASAQTNSNVKTAQEQPEITYSYYTVVAGSFTLAENAKKYAAKIKAKGYEPYFRKGENGYYRVCIYRLKTQVDAENRITKMKHIDEIFYKAWVLGYNDISENLNADQL